MGDQSEPGHKGAGDAEQGRDDQSRARLRDDISYMRALAEEGRSAPLISGIYYVLWSSVGVLGGLWQFAVLTRAVAAPEWSVMLVWFGLAGLAMIAANRLHGRTGQKPGAHSFGNRIEIAVWSAGGIAIGVFALSAASVALFDIGAPVNTLLPAGWVLLALLPPVVMMVYGIALYTSGHISDIRMLRIAGGASFFFTPILILLAGSPLQALAFAAAMALVSLWPGIVLLRAEPKEVV